MTEQSADALPTLTPKVAWAQTREITNRLDQMIALLMIVNGADPNVAHAEVSRTLPLRTNSPQDVNEPPNSIHCSIETVHHLNQAELQSSMREQIASGDLVLELVVGTTRYRAVLKEDNLPGITVLTRIP